MPGIRVQPERDGVSLLSVLRHLSSGWWALTEPQSQSSELAPQVVNIAYPSCSPLRWRGELPQATTNKRSGETETNVGEPLEMKNQQPCRRPADNNRRTLAYWRDWQTHLSRFDSLPRHCGRISDSEHRIAACRLRASCPNW